MPAIIGKTIRHCVTENVINLRVLSFNILSWSLILPNGGSIRSFILPAVHGLRHLQQDRILAVHNHSFFCCYNSWLIEWNEIELPKTCLPSSVLSGLWIDISSDFRNSVLCE